MNTQNHSAAQVIGQKGHYTGIPRKVVEICFQIDVYICAVLMGDTVANGEVNY